VIVLFAEGLAEIFAELPEGTKRKAVRSIDLLSAFPRMYPVRRRGRMRGYRYFIANQHVFYYSVASTEIRVTAIIPATMRLA
jgi:plasmid stabilization system protein ParE